MVDMEYSPDVTPPLSLCSAVPIQDPGVHVVDMEYSPLVGGFATVLSDGRAAFLTASSLKFDPNVSRDERYGLELQLANVDWELW